MKTTQRGLVLVALLAALVLVAGSRSNDIVGGLDFMATFAALAGVKLPDTGTGFQSFCIFLPLVGKTW